MDSLFLVCQDRLIILPYPTRSCDSRGVGGVGVFVNMNMAVIIDSFEQLTTRIGRLQMRRCGPIPALTIFVVYTPTSTYEEEEVESFYNDLEKLYREDYTLYKVIIGDFSTKIGLRRTHGELHIGTHGLQSNEKGERLSEFIMTTKTIHENSQFQKPYSLRWTWESPGGEYRNEIDHIIVSKKGGAARAASNQELMSELARFCREALKEDLKERRAEVLAEAAKIHRWPVFAGRAGPNISSTRFVPSPLSSRMFSSFVSDVDEVLESYPAELAAGPSV
ncbi:hypothetical protein RB195_001542 [Necator americanus]|uniref:Uncharacterized protein n=1 Tax=Necator americanus TaxID=51031 RepID=A0ABR1DET2_NECAM